MKPLLDTQVLLWAATRPERLAAKARRLLRDEQDQLPFSAASPWEIAIKRGLRLKTLRLIHDSCGAGLLDNGYYELPIVSDHVVAIDSLPPIHKDPFDRLLVA
jgi:PIN domain nuclease of toxin-antitoxin system